MSSTREATYRIQRIELARELDRAFEHAPIDWTRVRLVDIGCGRGDWLQYFHRRGVPEPQIWGVDLSPGRLSQAKQSLPGAGVCAADARLLPLGDAVFDAVCQFTLFSSLIRRQDRDLAAREMLRVLKPGGFVIWHDFFAPNPWNRKTRRVSRKQIEELFQGCTIALRKVTLVAPLARILCRISYTVLDNIQRLPILRTHYLGVIRKPGGLVK